MRHIIISISLLIGLFSWGCSRISTVEKAGLGEHSKIINLKVEGFANWVVTDEAKPRLSWQAPKDIPGKPLIGYELMASDQESKLIQNQGNLLPVTLRPIGKGAWMIFDASSLASRSSVWWKVRSVYEDKERGVWSDNFHFEVGLKHDSDWTAEWIGMTSSQREKSAPWLRRSFEISKEISKARLYVCGLGLHESWLNGQKIGEEVLQPAQTDYNIRSFYIAHDLSQQLRQGLNTLGFWLGDGFYNQDRVWGPNGLSYGQPKVIAQLEIEYKDGSTELIGTDESWQTKQSAIKASNIYAGESYDARLYTADWAKVNTAPTGWQAANKLPPAGGKLVAQQLPPSIRTGRVPVKDVRQLHANTWILDFGQNLVGWAKMKVNASPGTRITIRYAEDKLPSGELNYATSGVKATKVIQTDEYICKGNGEEIWEPRFSYHGFRYAEVSVEDGALKEKSPGRDFLEGIVIHTDMAITGHFSSSDSLINKLFDMAHWTQVGSVLGVPVDCPVRERCGWTGDAHLTVPYTMFRFDAASMWRKYTEDIASTALISSRMLCFGDEFGERSVQLKESGIPTMVAPGKRFIGEGSPDWGSAIAFIPWDIYLHTGDLRPLEKHYSSIIQWTRHLQGISTNDLVYSGMGDWVKPIIDNPEGKTDREIYGAISPMLSTACYYRSARITAEVARLLGKQEDYEYFDQLSREIRKAFTEAFYGDSPEYTPDQTVNAIAIDWNVLAPDRHKEVAANLNRQVKDAGYHFETGVFGMPSLWRVLGKYGYYQTAWKVLNQTDAPSFNYLIQRGATTFWEVWPTEQDEDIPYIQSMSHPFQGAFVRWFYEGLAGVQPDAEFPGYELIHFQPQIIDELEWVTCRFASPMGEIESSWKQENSLLSWTVEVPAGATGKLRVPGRLIEITKMQEVIKVEKQEITDGQGYAELIQLPAGKYQLKSKLDN
ncbi:family 78 glycoside hydrolase catalytic domain [Echinicola pacifica]|nr:family 78 glycoside hydrolase catalytic domain [Echinicola pacifica]